MKTEVAEPLHRYRKAAAGNYLMVTQKKLQRVIVLTPRLEMGQVKQNLLLKKLTSICSQGD